MNPVSVISLQCLSSSANIITAQKSVYLINWIEFVVVQSLSCVQFFATPWTAACLASLSFPVSQSFLRFMSIESVALCNHLILCCLFLLLPSVFPSIRVFSNEVALHIREGNGAPLQYSCLENPMGGGAWWATVHGVAKSQTRLSDFTFTFHFHALEKEMATHSSVLAWRIPGMGELGGLPSMGSHRVGHD